MSCGSGWGKHVVSQCLEFASSLLRDALRGTAQHSVAQSETNDASGAIFNRRLLLLLLLLLVLLHLLID